MEVVDDGVKQRRKTRHDSKSSPYSQEGKKWSRKVRPIQEEVVTKLGLPHGRCEGAACCTVVCRKILEGVRFMLAVAPVTECKDVDEVKALL